VARVFASMADSAQNANLVAGQEFVNTTCRKPLAKNVTEVGFAITSARDSHARNVEVQEFVHTTGRDLHAKFVVELGFAHIKCGDPLVVSAVGNEIVCMACRDGCARVVG